MEEGGETFAPGLHLEAEQTALLVVDMQYNDAWPGRGFVKVREEWHPGSTTNYVERLRNKTIPTIQTLLSYFRRRSLPVLYLALGGKRGDLSDLRPRVADAIAGSVKRSTGVDITHAYSVGDPDYEIIDPVAPLPDEPVIRKGSYGAFNSTDLEDVLRDRGIETLVIVGVTTSACVETTARDAADRGFGVILVDDGCADWQDSYHDSSLNAFRRLFGDVAGSAGDVISRLDGHEPPADRR